MIDIIVWKDLIWIRGALLGRINVASSGTLALWLCHQFLAGTVISLVRIGGLTHTTPGVGKGRILGRLIHLNISWYKVPRTSSKVSWFRVQGFRVEGLKS